LASLAAGLVRHLAFVAPVMELLDRRLHVFAPFLLLLPSRPFLLDDFFCFWQGHFLFRPC
jgi:hypothetical protein